MDEAVSAYMAKNPAHTVTARVNVSYVDTAGNTSVIKHEIECGTPPLTSPIQKINEKPVESQSQNITERIECINSLIANGNYDAALDEAHEAVNLQPENPSTHIILWRVLRAAGRDDTKSTPVINEALRLIESQDTQSRANITALEIDTREAFGQWLFLQGHLDDAKNQTGIAIQLAERAGLRERLAWLNLQMQTIYEAQNPSDGK
jgi:Flp pilus assembly protein TadD